MEKMQLGSPAGSPAQSGYLPNFLMGIDQTPTNHTFSNSPTASPDLSRSGFQQKFLTGLHSPILNSTNINQQINHSQQLYQSQNHPSSNNNNSVVGPPINSLFDSINARNDKSFQTPSKSFYQQHSQSIIHQDTPFHTQHNTSGFNQSRIMSPIAHSVDDFKSSHRNPMPHPISQYSYASMSMNDVSRFNHQDFWVTVFGFPPESTSIVLSHFSTCGTILDKVCSSGNWIHLRFSSRGECDKALLYNGKIIGNNLMIGVIRCNDESVIDKENSEYPMSSVSKIRSLTQAAYKSAKYDAEVIQGAEEPKKSSGIVHKTLDLIFGW